MIEVIVASVLIGLLALGVHLLERWLRRDDLMPQAWLDKQRKDSA